MPDYDSKVCTACQIDQPFANFYQSKTGRFGLAPKCKACVSAYGRQHYAANPEPVRAASTAWKQANPERARAAEDAWHAAHPDRVRRSQQKSAESHRPQKRAVTNSRRAADPESALARERSWRAENPDKDRASKRRWATNNPDCTLAATHRRRARLHNAFVENVSLVVLFQRDCGICGLCELQIPISHPNILYRASIDHIVPLYWGGLHAYANTQVAHLICNIRAGSKCGTYVGTVLETGGESG